MDATDRLDRVAGGLLGLLIGDAVGVPYEFHDAWELPDLPCIDMRPPSDFDRAHAGIPIGTWSDDGAQALCLLQSLLAQETLDLEDFSRRLVNWCDWGYMAVDGHVFDVGLQTQRALQRLRDGVIPSEAGPREEGDNGNGSLMRTLPLALWHPGDDQDLARSAALQSLPTHGHVRAQVACAMYCLWARAELQGKANTWEHAASALTLVGPSIGFPESEIAIVLSEANRAGAAGTGYVVDTLWSARIANERGSTYDSVVRSAIQFGNDTDTTAAVAGGIAGIRFGASGLREDWKLSLRGETLYAPLIERLVARHI
jgi:ADP-ribosyl-[dinitrogen reductase] hydrolase